MKISTNYLVLNFSIFITSLRVCENVIRYCTQSAKSVLAISSPQNLSLLIIMKYIRCLKDFGL